MRRVRCADFFGREDVKEQAKMGRVGCRVSVECRCRPDRKRELGLLPVRRCAEGRGFFADRVGRRREQLDQGIAGAWSVNIRREETNVIVNVGKVGLFL